MLASPREANFLATRICSRDRRLEDIVRICESKIPRDSNSSANLSIPGIPIDISHCFTSDISIFFRTLLNKTLEQFSHAPATYGIFGYAIKAGNKIRLADSCQSSLAFSSVLFV